MENIKPVLSVFFLLVIASGCINGGGETEGEGSISINTLSVSDTVINEGQSVNVDMVVQNIGVKNAEVQVGEKGDQILGDHCVDIFDVSDSFSARTNRVSETKDNYNLTPGDKLIVNWELNQQTDVPLYDYKCDLAFKVPFNYSVSSFRQVQLKQDSEVEGASNLQYKSSSGPLRFSIDTLQGSTGKEDVFITSEEEDRFIDVRLTLENHNPETGEKGLVNIDESSFGVKATQPLKMDENMNESGYWKLSDGKNYVEDKSCGSYDEDRCLSDEECKWERGVSTGGGSSNGQCLPRESAVSSRTRCEDIKGNLRLSSGVSKQIRCEIPIPSSIDSPGKVSEISASVNYTYIKDGGSRRIKVKTRG